MRFTLKAADLAKVLTDNEIQAARSVTGAMREVTDGLKGDLRAEADANLLKRWAEPVEVAYTVAFLASAEADFITGQIVCPNGGDPVI